VLEVENVLVPLDMMKTSEPSAKIAASRNRSSGHNNRKAALSQVSFVPIIFPIYDLES
jgi:hypothetical protein